MSRQSSRHHSSRTSRRLPRRRRELRFEAFEPRMLLAAMNDAYPTDHNVVLTVPAAGVLANDTPSGQTVGQVQGSAGNVGVNVPLASGATVNLASNGSFTYDPTTLLSPPAPDTQQIDSFTYTVATSGALAQWNFNTATAAETGAGFGATTLAPGLAASAVADGGGITINTSNPGTYPSNVLQTDPDAALANIAAAVAGTNKFFTFTVTPDAGAQLNLTSLTFNAARGGAGVPRGWGVRSSVDGFATNISTMDIPTVRSVLTSFSVDLSGAPFQNLSTAVTFRVYVYAPADGNTLEFDDLTLNGSLTSTATVNVTVFGPNSNTAYVDDDFVAGPIADADPVAVGNQPATFGTNAFTSVNAAIAAIAAGGKVIVNAGNYSSEAVNIDKQLTMKLQQGPISFGSLDDSVANATVNLLNGITFTAGANGNSTQIDSAVIGNGTLIKTGGGVLTVPGSNITVSGVTVDQGTLKLVNSGVVTGSIGVKFVGGNGATALAAGDVAGVVPIANWNNFTGATGTPNAILKDSFGLDTTAVLNSYAANGTFGTTSSNTLINGYLDQTGATAQTVAISNIPYSTYDVYAYFGSDGANRTGSVQLNGGVTYHYQTRGNVANFVQTTATAATGPLANYAVWSGTTGSTVNISLFRGSNNSGLHGIEIVGPAASAAASFANTSLVVNAGATFDLNGNSAEVASLAGGGNVTSSATGGAILTAGRNNASTTFTGNISDGSGQVGFTKTGSGTMILGSTSTYTGATTINNGMLQANAADRIPTNSLLTIGAAGVFDMNDQDQTLAGLSGAGRVIDGVAGGNTPTLTINGATSTTFSGILGNTNADGFHLAKQGTGRLTLGGANTYTGTTTVTGGTLQLGNNSALGGVASGTTVGGSGTLDFGGFRAGPDGQEPLSVSGTGAGGLGVLANSATAVVLGVTRVLTMTGDSTFSANVRWDIRDDGADPVTFDMNDFTLTKIGGAELCIVGGTVLDEGNVNVNAGTFRLETTTDFDEGTGPTMRTISVAAGATLDFWQNTNTFNVNVTLAAGANFSTNDGAGAGPTFPHTFTLNGVANFNLEKDSVFSGQFTGSGGINKVTGTGKLILTNNANNYTGVTTISAGTLQITQPNALGTVAGATLIGASGTLEIEGALNYSTAEPLVLFGTINKSGGSGTLSTPLSLFGTPTLSANAGSTLNVTSPLASDATTTLTLGGAGNVDLNTDYGNGASLTSLPNALSHFGFHVPNADADDPLLDLSGNGGIMSGGNPTTHPNFFASRVFTWGPGLRGLDFNDDNDFLGTGAVGQADNYTNLWIGMLTVPAGQGGVWRFVNTTNDDREGIWLDIDQDGVFESSGTLGSNQTEQLSWENSNVDKTATLTAGQSYMIAFVHRELTGGSTSEMQFQSPTMSARAMVRPADPAQAGIWSTLPAVPPAVNNGLSKTGTGTATLTRALNYNGITTVNAGTLVVAHPNALGIGPAGTIVRGGTLGLANIALTGEALTLNGLGAAGQGGALASISGNSSYTGPITGQVVANPVISIGAAVGASLVVNGNVDLQFSRLVLGGDGNTTINSPITGQGTGVPIVANALIAERYTVGNNLNFSTNGGGAYTVGADGTFTQSASLLSGAPTNSGVQDFGHMNFRHDAGGTRFLWDTLFPGLGTANRDNFQVVWMGQFTPNTTGTWSFRSNDQDFAGDPDDDASIYIDANRDGIFQAAEGFTAGGTSTIAQSLTAGLAYNIVIGFHEGTGDDRISYSVQGPAGSGLTTFTGINPIAPAQLGLWTTVVGFADNSVTKTGAGTATLAGNNTYNGTTTVSAGTLIAAHNNALGTTTPGTTVAAGATLSFSGGVTVAENVVVNTTGNLGNLSGNNTLTGNVDMVSLPPIQDYALLDISRGGSQSQLEPGFTHITLGNNADIAGNYPTAGFTSSTGDAYTVGLTPVDQAGATVGASIGATAEMPGRRPSFDSAKARSRTIAVSFA